MLMKRIFKPLLIALACCIATACSDNDNNEPAYPIDRPDNAVTQELGKMYNGRTLLGETGIFIDYEDRFCGTEDNRYAIYRIGERSTFDLEPLLDEMEEGREVVPGCFYQAVHKDDLYGNMIRNGATYLNIRVDSWLRKGKEITGAKVTYSETTKHDEVLDTCCMNLKMYASPELGKKNHILYLPDVKIMFVKLGLFKDSSVPQFQIIDEHTMIVTTYRATDGPLKLTLGRGKHFVERDLVIETKPEE